MKTEKKSVRVGFIITAMLTATARISFQNHGKIWAKRTTVRGGLRHVVEKLR
jgi:hypothetical protein